MIAQIGALILAFCPCSERIRVIREVEEYYAVPVREIRVEVERVRTERVREIRIEKIRRVRSRSVRSIRVERIRGY